MNDNILTGYCFLAALTENQNDLYNQVYIPICKRTLSLYSLQDKTYGRVDDIKHLIAKEYGINVPTLVVKKLINATFKSLSDRAKKKYKFNVFQNGESFEIEKYAFSDLVSISEQSVPPIRSKVYHPIRSKVYHISLCEYVWL